MFLEDTPAKINNPLRQATGEKQPGLNAAQNSASGGAQPYTEDTSTAAATIENENAASSSARPFAKGTNTVATNENEGTPGNITTATTNGVLRDNTQPGKKSHTPTGSVVLVELPTGVPHGEYGSSPYSSTPGPLSLAGDNLGAIDVTGGATHGAAPQTEKDPIITSFHYPPGTFGEEGEMHPLEILSRIEQNYAETRVAITKNYMILALSTICFFSGFALFPLAPSISALLIAGSMTAAFISCFSISQTSFIQPRIDTLFSFLQKNQDQPQVSLLNPHTVTPNPDYWLIPEIEYGIVHGWLPGFALSEDSLTLYITPAALERHRANGRYLNSQGENMAHSLPLTPQPEEVAVPVQASPPAVLSLASHVYENTIILDGAAELKKSSLFSKAARRKAKRELLKDAAEGLHSFLHYEKYNYDINKFTLVFVGKEPEKGNNRQKILNFLNRHKNFSLSEQTSEGLILVLGGITILSIFLAPLAGAYFLFAILFSFAFMLQLSFLVNKLRNTRRTANLLFNSITAMGRAGKISFAELAERLSKQAEVEATAGAQSTGATAVAPGTLAHTVTKESLQKAFTYGVKKGWLQGYTLSEDAEYLHYNNPAKAPAGANTILAQLDSLLKKRMAHGYILLIAFFVLYIIFSILESFSNPLALIFGTPSLFLLFAGFITTARSDENRAIIKALQQYLAVLEGKPCYPVSAIAKESKVAPVLVAERFGYAISKGWLPGITLSPNKKYILTGEGDPLEQQAAAELLYAHLAAPFPAPQTAAALQQQQPVYTQPTPTPAVARSPQPIAAPQPERKTIKEATYSFIHTEGLNYAINNFTLKFVETPVPMGDGKRRILAFLSKKKQTRSPLFEQKKSSGNGFPTAIFFTLLIVFILAEIQAAFLGAIFLGSFLLIPISMVDHSLKKNATNAALLFACITAMGKAEKISFNQLANSLLKEVASGANSSNPIHGTLTKEGLQTVFEQGIKKSWLQGYTLSEDAEYLYFNDPAKVPFNARNTLEQLSLFLKKRNFAKNALYGCAFALFLLFFCSLLWGWPLAPAFLLPGTAFFATAQEYTTANTHVRELKQFIALLGENPSCAIDTFATACKATPQNVLAAFENGIKKGWLPGIFVSPNKKYILKGEGDLLIKQQEAALLHGQENESLQGQQAVEPPAQTAEESGAKATEVARTSTELLEKGVRLNGRLATLATETNSVILQKQLEKLCATNTEFFAHLGLFPHDTDEIEKVVNYYMPTAVSLTEAHLQMEESGLPEEDTANVRANILNTLGTIQLAFDKLYPTILEQAAIDVGSDIDVLQQMLHIDDLSGRKDF